MINKIYNTLILISDLYIYLNSYSNEKNKKLYIGRKKTFKTLNVIKESNLKYILIHVSSVGEYEQAKPIIFQLSKNYSYKIIVSYFSPSVEKIINKSNLIFKSFYIPSDKKSNMSKMFNLIKPEFILLIKYEFWKNFIAESRKKNVPIFSVVSTFRKNQIFFRFHGFFFRKILNDISYFLVQDEKSKKLLKKININNVKVVGDSRYDRVFNIYSKAKKYIDIEKFINNNKTIVIGSSWQSDLNIIKNEIKKDLTNTKYIIAPHNVNNNEIINIEKLFINDTIRYSDLPQKNILKRILIIDNIGMLSSIYRYADISYIGGAFQGTLHNTLEAAVWGNPIIYGKNSNNKKFKEVKILEKSGIGFSIKNGQEFKLIINRIFKNRELGKGGNKLISEKSGATNKIISFLKKEIK